MKGLFTVSKLQHAEIWLVHSGNGDLFCESKYELRAQRIADALNAVESFGASLEQELKRHPAGLTGPSPKPSRDPDRVRLAAAALGGIASRQDYHQRYDAGLLSLRAVELSDATLAQLDATHHKPDATATPQAVRQDAKGTP